MKEYTLIIEPALSGLDLIEAVKTLSYEPIVFTADCDQRIIPDEYRNNISIYKRLDTNDLELCILNAIDLAEKYQIKAVIPGSEFYVIQATIIANILNLPGNSIQSAYALRNKFIMRKKLAEAKVRTPKFALIQNEQDLTQAAKQVGFPAVIKPLSQSGSVFVSKVTNEKELKAAYIELSNSDWMDMEIGVGRNAILEGYIEVKQKIIAVGTVFNAKPLIVSKTDTLSVDEPHFTEIQHIIPAHLEEEVENRVNQHVSNVIKALDVQIGSFVADIVIDQNEMPYVVDIGGRIVGDKIPKLAKKCTGMDLAQLSVRSHLGEAYQDKDTECINHIGIRFFKLADKARYDRVDGLELIEQSPNLLEYTTIIPPGESVPILNNFQCRVAYVIAEESTRERLDFVIDQARSKINHC